MPNRMRFVWLLPLVALALGYAAGHLRRETLATRADASDAADGSEDPRAARATQAAVAPEVRAVTSVPSKIDMPPMPPDDARLADAFDTLATRARSGDTRAAVRLLDATTRCLDRNRLTFLANAADEKMLDASEAPAVREHVERLRERARARLAESETLCADVAPTQLANAGEWLERGAHGGDPGAETCYAAMGGEEAFAPRRGSDAWIDWMQRYRDNARSLAESAFAAGVPQAADVLYEMVAGRYAFVPYFADSTIAPDYARAYALAWFEAKRLAPGEDVLGPGEVSRWRVRAHLLERELSAAEIANARAWAEAEAASSAMRPKSSLPCSTWDDAS